MRYKNLIFDLYGTLVDIHTEEDAAVWKKTALYFGYYGAHYTPEALETAFRAAMTRREAQAGQSYECYPDIPCEEIFAQLFRDAGITENADTLGLQAAQVFRICATEYIRLYPHVLSALEVLRAKGCKLWLLSNAQRVFTAYELRHLGLTDAFDGIYISSDYRCRKPDRRFYRALLEAQGLDPATCLMIGNDRSTDIAGAQALGMATLYLHTALTPADQASADPKKHPKSHPGCQWEFEGDDWEAILSCLLQL